ncbi:hypothetical protein EFA69_15620 [Rufibacter immobilis]|uniref:Twitching motility protein PilT n=1 Tax=Rufibacter immobilis TaxID=1348778 RepID=A0A3M9MPU6_9BACT|nr:Mut7-C RNAse domain-containing protein [Rufibacter immobilis]RNI27552.1 hypothetical protein EFA69_15620 [Rufibacter immobilis]
MEHWANFLFHGELNDFLPKRYRQVGQQYHFSGSPALKDAIEALGVPHPEVGHVQQNGQEVLLKARLEPFAEVQVFPVVPEASAVELPPLQVPVPKPARFVLDVHLGKLARYLRLLGFDTLYQNHYSDADIAALAAQEQRIVLTRDVGLLKQKQVVWGYWLRSQHWEEQLREVINQFNLLPQVQPFCRCLACNGEIARVSKEAVLPLLPPKTRLFFQEFYQCPHCRRVYWKGSHYEKMERFLSHLRSSANLLP